MKTPSPDEPGDPMDLDLSGEEIARIIEHSERQREDQGPDSSPAAVDAWYDGTRNLVMIAMANGCVFGFPPRDGEGLESATPEQLARVEVTADGFGLAWEELDAHIAVAGIIFHLLKIPGWYARWLGRTTSPAKAAAARENGKKGGRPRTKAPAAKRSGHGRATGGD